MGTSGVPWNISKDSIIEALKARKGKITYAARDLKVHYTTLKKRVYADSELLSLIDELRNEFNAILVDSAEDTMLYAMQNRKNDLASALKSCFYILNNKGKHLGYSQKTITVSGDEISIRAIAQGITECDSGVPSTGEFGEPLVEAEQSILDQEPARQEDQVSTELGTTDSVEGATLL